MKISNTHLGLETLERLACGDSSVSPAQVDHLVDCDSCAGNLIQLFPEDVEGRVYELLDEPDGPPPVADLPAALCRLLDAYRQRRDAESAAAPQAVAALLEMDQEERLTVVRKQPAFGTLPVAETLLKEIPNWWHRDPHHAGDLAELAVTILEPLDPAAPFAVSPSRALEALAHAWALRGNALRVQGDLAAAERDLEHAGELAERTGRVSSRGRVARLLAELLRDLRRFEEARLACQEAGQFYSEAADRQMVARTRVLLASILGESGDHEGAVSVLQELLQSRDREQLGEENYLAASQSLSYELLCAGQPQEALVRLAEAEALLVPLAQPLAHCRITWVRALALAKAGEEERSEFLLRQVLETFLAREMTYDAALAGLDLAASYLHRGELGQARQLAEELNPIFLSRGVHREATAAGLLATRALEQESATVAMLQHVSRFLHHARRDPSLRYEGFTH